MTEHEQGAPASTAASTAAATGPIGQQTGNPQVDQVLGTLDSLADLPVDQHVAVFEAAHVALRDALSDAQSRG